MLPYPKLHTNEPTIPAIWGTLKDIVNFLPRLEAKGDGKTTSVTQGVGGQVIKAVPPMSSSPRVSVESTPEEVVDDMPWTASAYFTSGVGWKLDITGGWYRLNSDVMFFPNQTGIDIDFDDSEPDIPTLITLEAVLDTTSPIGTYANYDVNVMTRTSSNMYLTYTDNHGLAAIGDVRRINRRP